MFDDDDIRRIATALLTNERYVEKDWHLVRALSIIAQIQVSGVTAVFSGGTSLATAYQLIRRFSEDIDFKVIVDVSDPKKLAAARRTFRDEVVKHLQAADFVMDGEPVIANASRFFRASFHYGPRFPDAAGIRPTLQVEMTFGGTKRLPQQRAVHSLLSRSLRQPPEIDVLACVDPIETAADKMAALAWRVAKRDRSQANDDPAIIRHLHDLAALAPLVAGNEEFRDLAREVLIEDAARAKTAGTTGSALLANMLPAITNDALWQREYEQFVGAVSFGKDDEHITFDRAVNACSGLVGEIQKGWPEKP